ncbi:MAG: glycoside hydrolase family 99-like domain-containing protein [Kiritimatiellae bacterium]|nr:glycoside hydrolase family 99-like domain-containing protein [Kiritimatiellia bacterium]
MNKTMTPDRCDVAVYYFPQWHVDPKNERKHGYPWTEWELVQTAKPKFPGHRQPKVPAWGYGDEADPLVMAGKIDAAADHGIDVFLFDWYYNNDGPFLQRALENGFMRARNADRLSFALMWANHPLGRTPGEVNAKTFDALVDLCVNRYFAHPSYWKPGGRPYFAIYHLHTFLKSFGSVEGGRRALEKFRNAVRAAGYEDLHLSVECWSVPFVREVEPGADQNEVLAKLGVASLDSYVWVDHVRRPDFPATDYDGVRENYFEFYRKARADWRVPLRPNVSMGWDSSPRCKPDQPWENKAYPYGPVVVGNTPARFAAALEEAKALASSLAEGQRVVTVNSWNEWTEGSYLEPDTENGLAYLEAIRRVFGARRPDTAGREQPERESQPQDAATS